MQTFKKFIETREVIDIPHNRVEDILLYLDDPIICVKFALYCAKDCFQFNNEQTRGPAQICIDLIEKWLKNHKSVNENQLNHAVDNANRSSAANAANAAEAAYAVDTAADAADVVSCIIDNANVAAYNGADSAAHYASYSFACAYSRNYGDSEWRRFRNQKLQEYTDKLKSLTVTRSGNLYASQNILHASQEEDIVRGLNIAFDELEDLGNYDFIYQKDNKWIFDLHYTKLEGKSRDDLIDKIANDKYYLDAFRRLYYEGTK